MPFVFSIFCDNFIRFSRRFPEKFLKARILNSLPSIRNGVKAMKILR